MIESWQWQRISDFVEDFGFGDINFFLDQEDPETGENMEISILDVVFDEAEEELRVTLG